MIIYIFISAILFWVSVLETNLSLTKIQKKIISISIFLALTLVQIFKSDTVGSDLPIYTNLFNLCKQSGVGFGVGYEPGFIAINKIFLLIFDNVHVFYSIIYIFINFSIYRLIKRYSSNYSYSWLLFIWFGYWGQSFYVLRQYLALAIIINSILCYIDNKKILARFLFILAFSVHYTSFVVGLSYIFYKCYIRYKKYIDDYLLVIIILFISVFASNNIINKLITLFTKYNKYLDTGGEGQVMLLITICIFLFYKIFYKNCEGKKIIMFTAIMTILLQGFALNMEVFQRISVYISIINIIGISNTIMKKGKAIDKFIIHQSISFIMFGYYMYIMRSSSIVPYIPFWR